jgi:uncharacterized cupin superfamily protein
MPDPKTLIRTSTLDWSKARHGRHPFNPASEMRRVPLGDLAGLQRVPVHLLRVPPGKETFVPHAHAIEEEWAFVLEGEGVVSLDGVDHPIGPGDYIGFPTDGVIHQIRNTGAVDLLYLTGGERSPVEIADMPSLGKVAVFKDDAVTFYDKGTAESVTMAEWAERAAIKDE